MKSFLPLGLVLFATGIPQPSPVSDGLEEAVDRIAQQAVVAGVQGLSVTLAFGGELAIQQGWGYVETGEPAQGDSLYRVGALTEAFLACAILQMVEADELALDTAIVEYLPELAPESAEVPEEAEEAEEAKGTGSRLTSAGGLPAHSSLAFSIEDVLLEHLLTHTSGLPSYEDYLGAQGVDEIDVQEVLKWLAGMPLDFEPGSCAQASDTNGWLLGLILERKRGLSVPMILAEQVFTRAGMDQTGYDFDGPVAHQFAYEVHEFAGTEIVHESRPQAFGSENLCSSADDLASWMRSLVTRELVSDSSFKAMTAPPTFNHHHADGRGLGLDVTQLEDEPCFSVGGSSAGYRARVAFYPGLELTVVVLAAGDEAPVQQIERRIARAAFGMPEPGFHDRPLSGEEATSYTGDYMVGCNLYYITFENGDLILQTPRGKTFALAYQGLHTFLARDDLGISVRFDVDEGDADSFLLTEHGVESFARRMR